MVADARVTYLDLQSNCFYDVAPLNIGRYDHTSAVLEGKVYVFAGWTDTDWLCARKFSIEVYSD